MEFFNLANTSSPPEWTYHTTVHDISLFLDFSEPYEFGSDKALEQNEKIREELLNISAIPVWGKTGQPTVSDIWHRLKPQTQKAIAKAFDTQMEVSNDGDN